MTIAISLIRTRSKDTSIDGITSKGNPRIDQERGTKGGAKERESPRKTLQTAIEMKYQKTSIKGKRCNANQSSFLERQESTNALFGHGGTTKPDAID